MELPLTNFDDDKGVDDINDIFDSIVCSEESVSKKAYEEGFKLGLDEGLKEGHHLGYHKGFETGSLIGYYKGFVCELLKIEKLLKELDFYDKAYPTIEKLKRLTETFPTSNDHSVDILSLLDECKIAYKKLCALLKLKFDLPEPKFLTY